MRPLYESRQDVVNQEAIRNLLQGKWKCTLVPAARNAAIDYYAIDAGGLIKGLVEVKCRTNHKNKYDTFLLSFHKILSAEALSKNLNIPVLLVVGWTDEVGYTKLNPASTYNTKQGGRVDRNDPQDIHEVALIPNDSFTFIAKRKDVENV